MTTQRPRAPAVQQWEDLASDFSGADLLLGNGFSIREWPAFAYDSLFHEFLTSCDPVDTAAFDQFNSSNFEFILETLARAILANRAFALDTRRLEDGSRTLKEGLIRAVQTTHPRYEDLDADRIRTLSEQLDLFNDIFTTNYDCLLYHIIMASKDRHEQDPKVRPYNDYYWEKLDDDHLAFKSYQNISKYKHIYYLHGALFLFRRDYSDVKVRTGEGTELIDRIAAVIRVGEIPLFVSEGSAAEKREAIYRSDYLRFASDRLSRRRETLVVFGSALADVDRHVVAAIREGTKRIAYGVHQGHRTDIEVEDEQLRLIRALGHVPIEFFWSDGLFA